MRHAEMKNADMAQPYMATLYSMQLLPKSGFCHYIFCSKIHPICLNAAQKQYVTDLLTAGAAADAPMSMHVLGTLLACLTRS